MGVLILFMLLINKIYIVSFKCLLNILIVVEIFICYIFQVIDLVHEIRYIETIQKTDLFPSEAQALFDSVKLALLGQFLLASTLQWYDHLARNLMDFEIMLIKEDWEKVSQDLKKGLNEKWTKSGKYIF